MKLVAGLDELLAPKRPKVPALQLDKARGGNTGADGQLGLVLGPRITPLPSPFSSDNSAPATPKAAAATAPNKTCSEYSHVASEVHLA